MDICNDSRKVEIRGVEFDCPACGRNSSFGQKITNSIYLKDYKIVEYIINGIAIKGPESKSSFSEKCKDYYDLPVVSFSMFARSGSSYNSICTRRVPSSEIDKNPNPERIVSARGIDDFIFTEKKFASEAVIRKDMTPRHSMTVKGSYKLLTLLLQNKEKKVNSIVENLR